MTDISWPFATSSSGGTPGGSSPQMQFNNSGAFGGTVGLEFDSANSALRGLTGLTRGIELFNTSDITTNTERLRMFWSANVVTISTDTQGTGIQREMRIGTYAGGSAQNYFRMFGTGGSVSCQLQLANSGYAGIVGFNVAPSTYNTSSGTQTVMQIQGTCNQSGTAGFYGLLINPTITTTGSGGTWLLQVQNSSSFRAGVAVNGQFRLSSGSGQVDFSPNGNSLIISPGASSSALTSVQILNGTMATNSSGTYVGVCVAGAMSQSLTAAYTGFLVNITETAVGSGAKRLIDTQIAGASRWAITNVGIPLYTPSTTQTLLAADAVLANRGMIKVQGNGGAVTLTSTPTIAAGTEGEVIFIVGQSNTNTVTVQDRGTLASSNLRLGATTRVLGNGDVLGLVYDGTLWSEVYYANNL